MGEWLFSGQNLGIFGSDVISPPDLDTDRSTCCWKSLQCTHYWQRLSGGWRGNDQACFLLSHPVFLVLAIGNVANTSVHRLCLCRFQSVCKCLVCVWAGTIGVRVKWVVGRWQHGDHYQKGNVCFCHSLLGEQTHNVLICQSWLANHWLQTLFIVNVFVLLKYYLYHYWHQWQQKRL